MALLRTRPQTLQHPRLTPTNRRPESTPGAVLFNPQGKAMAGKDFNSNTANNDEWLTPPEIIKALGPFDLDPCAPVNRPWDMAKKHYTVQDNGLYLPWAGRVWLNPPYGRETFKWMERLSEHGNGIALIFARTETKGFHEQIWRKAKAVFFFEGRLKFHYVDGRQGGGGKRTFLSRGLRQLQRFANRRRDLQQ